MKLLIVLLVLIAIAAALYFYVWRPRSGNRRL